MYFTQRSICYELYPPRSEIKHLSGTCIRGKCKIPKHYDFLIFLLGILPLSVLLFVKCRYGFAIIDEAFYLSIPYRLYQGDILLLEEWNLSQLAGWILKLPVSAFVRITGSTDGIYLFFRYLYVLLHLCGSVLLFLLLRKRTGIGAVTAAFFYFLYVPFSISTLCYNSMGIEFLTLSTILLVCCASPWSDAISGCFLALAVLCCPFLAILFFIYGAAVLLFCRHTQTLPFLKPKRFARFSLGIAVPACFFLADVLPNIRLSQWSQILKGLFSDPEHSEGLASKLVDYATLLCTNQYIVGFFVAILIGVLVKNDIVRAVLSGAVLLLTAVFLLRGEAFLNCFMLPLSFAGLYFYVVYRDPRVKDLFYGVWVPGVVYSVCIHLSSNQRYFAICSALTVSLVASVIIIVITLKTIIPDCKPAVFKYGLVGALVLLFVLQFSLELKERWNRIFWDEGGIQAQTQLIEAGTVKGIYVNQEFESTYLANLDTASHLDLQKSLLVLGPDAYLYLSGSYRNSSYSAWLGGSPESGWNRLNLYYSLNPNKVPQQILVEPDYLRLVPEIEKNTHYVLRYTASDGSQIYTRNS